MQPSLYNAARYGAAVLKQPWYGGIIRLTGPERLSWLQGMVTNDVEKLQPGEGTYAAHLNAQGKLVGTMKVLVDTDAVWLFMETSSVKRLGDSLESMIIMEDVQSEQHTENFLSIGVFGLAAKSMLETWLGEPLNLEKEYQHRETSQGHRIVRDELGFTIWARVEKSESVFEEISAARATIIDETTWNVIRIEAGIPIYGIDIDDTTTLPELGEKGISYDKGCYIGQEVVARIKYIGHVNRRFMGFVCEGDVAVAPRATVRIGGKEVGYITSSVISPGVEKAIALGFVQRVAASAGTPVELMSGVDTIAATVSELPFIR